jgi:dihydroorotase
VHAALDVAVKDGKILADSQNIPETGARNVMSAKGKIVTPGFIDIHVHCFDRVSFGANADRTCLGRGVTTVVDAGSVGYPMIGAFISTSSMALRCPGRSQRRERPRKLNRTHRALR